MSENIKKEILANAIRLSEYLSVYGIDKYNTKGDILILSLIDEMLEQNCYFDFIDECTFRNIKRYLAKLLHSNPQLMYCRMNLGDYINLDGKQNIDTYKLIKERVI